MERLLRDFIMVDVERRLYEKLVTDYDHFAEGGRDAMIFPAKYDGICKLCKRSVKIGDQVGYKPGEKGVWCMNCVPADVKNPPRLDRNGMPPYPGHPGPFPQPQPTPSRLTKPPVLGTTALLKAMSQFEDAVIEMLASPRRKVTDEIEDEWKRYSKLKAHALQPGSDQEGTTALRKSMQKIIELVVQ